MGQILQKSALLGKGRKEVILTVDLDEGETIFDWLWFGQKLGERLTAKVRRLMKQFSSPKKPPS